MIYAWNIGEYEGTDNFVWNKALHDIRNTGSLTGVAFNTTSGDDYWYYTLAGDDCTVNLTLESTGGDHILSVRTDSDVCDNTWDSQISVPNGVVSSLIEESLAHGSYALSVSGTGGYILKRNSFCNIDPTDPRVGLGPLPSAIRMSQIVSAELFDEGGIVYCEVCVSNSSCDEFDWITDGVSLDVSNTEGTCSYLWNISSYQDATYNVNMRAWDTGNNSGTGTAQSVRVDTVSPTIYEVLMEPRATLNSTVELTINASDDVTIKNITASIGDVAQLATNGTLLLKTPPAAGDYTVRVTVTDEAGNTDSNQLALRIDEPIVWSNDACFTCDDLESISPNLFNDIGGNRHLVRPGQLLAQHHVAGFKLWS